MHLHLIKEDGYNHIHATAAYCTHRVVAICLELSQFQATTKGLNISEFPSEWLRNFPLMTPLRERRDRVKKKNVVCVVAWGSGVISHLLKWGGSTGEDKEVSFGGLSEGQTDQQHLQAAQDTCSRQQWWTQTSWGEFHNISLIDLHCSDFNCMYNCIMAVFSMKPYLGQICSVTL